MCEARVRGPSSSGPSYRSHDLVAHETSHGDPLASTTPKYHLFAQIDPIKSPKLVLGLIGTISLRKKLGKK